MELIKDASNGYITCPPAKQSKTYKSIGDLIFTNMHKHSDKIMQIQAETEEKQTFTQVLSKAIKTAIEMRKRGITQNDIICLDTNNHLNAVVPFLGGLLLGVKVASLDPILSLKDTSSLLNHIKPKILFVSQNAMDVVEEAVSKIELQCEIVAFVERIEKHTKFSEFLKESDEETDFRPVEIEGDKETAIIFFSSGTTGLPKGICLSHYSLMTAILTILEIRPRLDKGELFFPYPTTLYWISTVFYTMISILNGSPRLLTLGYDPKQFWTYCKKYRPTTILTAPSCLIELIKHYPEKQEVDTSSINSITLGGAPIRASQLEYAQSFFPTSLISQLYGCTEVSAIVTILPFNQESIKRKIMTRPTSCGLLLPGTTVKLVDVETDEPVTGPFQKGEIRVKSDFMMNGYYNVDSSDVWDEEGFFKTGDVLYYDEEYFFYYAYRMKEMFKYKTWHVEPAAIENVLRVHPAVQSAVVIGVPHPEDVNHPLAVIILKDGVEATAEEILKFANERLDVNKQIRAGVKIVKKFPMTPSGKIQRVVLRKMAMADEL